MRTCGYIIVLSWLFIVVLSCRGFTKTIDSSLETIYHSAQREFHNKNFHEALSLFEKYLAQGESGLNRKERLFWTIDQIGYIYLRVNKDPDGAIQFFKQYKDDLRLNEAQQDAILGWIGAASDWKKEKLKPSTIKSANDLYRLGSQYFNRGIKKKFYPLDDAGNADFAISESYLRPFMINYDKDLRIGDVLLMMGRIKFNLANDLDYWTESHYLKEAIRRFPHSKLAETAWEKLNEDTRFGYSGSSGDNTPPAVVEMLAGYQQLAHREEGDNTDNTATYKQHIEKKIEDANQLTNLELRKKYGNLNEIFAECSPKEEHNFISARINCNNSKEKAPKHWRNMDEAERFVQDKLAKKEVRQLLDFTSCDAYDLTWYELHCESDRIPVNDVSFKILFDSIDELGVEQVTTATWKRNTPDYRRIRNPRWLLRSRLYSKGFKLKNPWADEPHPTEDGTIILLEQKLNGKIYITGIPVTGVYEDQ